MTNWDIDRTRLLHFLLEATLAFLIISGFTFNWVPWISKGFLLLYLVGGFLFWIYFKFKKTASLNIIAIFSPVVVMVGVFVLQVSLFVVIPTIACLIWRVVDHFEERDHHNEIILFTISLLIGLIEYSIFDSTTYGKYIILTLLSQFILIMLIIVNRMYVDMKINREPSTSKLAVWSLRLTGFLFGAAVLLVMFFPYIQDNIISLINQILALLNNNSSVGTTEVEQPEIDFEQVQGTPDNTHDSVIIYIITGCIVFLLIIAFIFFMKNLKFNSFFSPSIQKQLKVISQKNDDLGVNTRKRRKSPPPTNDIRKRFYLFERQMIKYKFGRRVDESASDWLQRLNFEIDYEDVIKLYEKVRYGSLDLTLEEVKEYTQLMDEFTAMAKERYKRNKKNKT